MVKDHSSHLQIIGQLAREYEQKFAELEQLLTGAPAEKSFLQLRALAELSTDRFRSAQIALFSEPGLFGETGAENAAAAATAMCRAFDEMRILFQFLAEAHLGKPALKDAP